MSENIFFNPGQSIASEYDFNKAYVAAKLYHAKAKKPVLLTQQTDGQVYYIFDEDAALKEQHEHAQAFKIIERLENNQT